MYTNKWINPESVLQNEDLMNTKKYLHILIVLTTVNTKRKNKVNLTDKGEQILENIQKRIYKWSYDYLRRNNLWGICFGMWYDETTRMRQPHINIHIIVKKVDKDKQIGEINSKLIKWRKDRGEYKLDEIQSIKKWRYYAYRNHNLMYLKRGSIVWDISYIRHIYESNNDKVYKIVLYKLNYRLIRMYNEIIKIVYSTDLIKENIFMDLYTVRLIIFNFCKYVQDSEYKLRINKNIPIVYWLTEFKQIEDIENNLYSVIIQEITKEGTIEDMKTLKRIQDEIFF